MKRLRIGLNGFGRIGRAFMRIAHMHDTFDVVAVNTGKTTPRMLAYLLKYDSVYRTFLPEVVADEDGFLIDKKKITSYNIRNPEEIPWNKHEVDIVIDCTGVFKTRDDLTKHLHSGVKKVVLTAPTKDETIPHVVLGVNDDVLDFKGADIISNASCTTNCAAPMFKVLNDAFSIVSGFLTTTHAYTSSQPLLDNSAKDFTRARAAGLSIIPTTTGAATAVAKVIPELSGKIDAMALRVPTPVGSFADISCVVSGKVTKEHVNEAFKKQAEGAMKGIVDVAKIPLVSSDYIGSPFSCVFDPHYTAVVGDNLVKAFGWYDNEWGYSSRLVDVVDRLSNTV